MTSRDYYSVGKAIVVVLIYNLVMIVIGLSLGLCEFISIEDSRYSSCVSGTLFIGYALMLIGFLFFFHKKVSFKFSEFEFSWKYLSMAFLAGFVIVYIQAPLRYFFEVITGINKFGFSPVIVSPFENWILLTMISNALIIPIIEELIFRELIFSRLLVKFHPIKAMLISSVLFGLVHLPNVSQVIFAFFGGMLSCVLLVKTKNIFYSIIFHIVWNGLIFLSYYIPIIGLSTS